jgi:hypothetical protein
MRKWHPGSFQRRIGSMRLIEIAAHTTDIKNKLTLLNMARAWLRLAAQSEKNIYETSGAEPHT